jgi:hypothetical protein
MAFVRPAQEVIARNRSAGNVATAVMRYPSDAAAHAMIFNFKQYTQRGGTARNSVSGSNGSIALPLPKTVQDITSPDVMGRELGIKGAAVGDIVAGVNSAEGLLARSGQVLSDIEQAILGAGPSGQAGAGSFGRFALFAARAGLTAIGGSEVEQGLGAALGTAVNPHQALVFNGVALKQYTFDWTLIPNNEAESVQIKNIVNKFKRASLPSYGGPDVQGSDVIRRALLNYPDMVDVFFVGLDQAYFPLFKTAMISSVIVDYTPQGHVVVNKGEAGSRPAMWVWSTSAAM